MMFKNIVWLLAVVTVSPSAHALQNLSCENGVGDYAQICRNTGWVVIKKAGQEAERIKILQTDDGLSPNSYDPIYEAAYALERDGMRIVTYFRVTDRFGSAILKSKDGSTILRFQSCTRVPRTEDCGAR